jgi:hypothetical protein
MSRHQCHVIQSKMTACVTVGRHHYAATVNEYVRGACPTGEQRMFALRLSGVHSPDVAAIYSLSRLNDLLVGPFNADQFHQNQARTKNSSR